MKTKLLQNYRFVPPSTLDSIGQLVEYADESPAYHAEPVNFQKGRFPSEIHFHQNTYISHHVEHVRVWMNCEPGLIPTKEGAIVIGAIFLLLVFAPDLISLCSR